MNIKTQVYTRRIKEKRAELANLSPYHLLAATKDLAFYEAYREEMENASPLEGQIRLLISLVADSRSSTDQTLGARLAGIAEALGDRMDAQELLK